MILNTKENQVYFEDVLSDRYLSYALSTIMSRSLPDVRDGLKPVHRRLIYSMFQLKLDPRTGYKKCARIIGDVIGKYHPHGEISVYDALVRMAQSFASRYPIVDGQGNFGSIDGDNQAAMRYTEAKLTVYAMLLLRDIENDTIDFKSNYDGSESEPLVLPASVPNILANGTEGIAVGMATSIPPHNISELMDAVSILLKDDQAEISDIMEVIKGPDFPTGGSIVEPQDSILNSYTIGRGSFRLRAKWEIEELPFNKYQIIIKEIPYQVNKKNIIERLATLYQEKKILFLDSFQDLSADDIKIVLTPKNKTIDPKSIMEYLFKITDLEIKVYLNMNVLNSSSIPMVMNIKEILQEFISHRTLIIKRKLKNRLQKVNRRLEILDGLLVTYLNLDEIITIIREEEEPKPIMVARWGLTDLQAEEILNTRLRSLKKLEEIQIRNEHSLLSKERQELNENLHSDKKILNLLSEEIKNIKKQLEEDSNNSRKTQIIEEIDFSIPKIEDLVENEDIIVTCSALGWMKAIKSGKYDAIKYKEGDKERFVIKAGTIDKLLVFTDYGKFYTLFCDRITCSKGDGDPIRVILNMDANENILEIIKYSPDEKLLLASYDGRGFIVKSSDVIAQTKGGRQIMSCRSGGARAVVCKKVVGKYIAIMGENRRLLLIDIKGIPEMKSGRGVVLQKFKHGGIKALELIRSDDELKSLMPNGKIDVWKGIRGGLGRLVMDKIWIDR
jgi:topoisomerase IV subunit A